MISFKQEDLEASAKFCKWVKELISIPDSELSFEKLVQMRESYIKAYIVIDT